MKKKFLFAAALVAAITLASCGGKSNSAAPAADSTETVDSDSASTSANAGAKALAPETQKAMSTLESQVSEAVKNKDSKALTTGPCQFGSNIQDTCQCRKT